MFRQHKHVSLNAFSFFGSNGIYLFSAPRNLKIVLIFSTKNCEGFSYTDELVVEHKKAVPDPLVVGPKFASAVSFIWGGGCN